MYGSRRIGVFKFPADDSEAQTLYELTDNIGNVRAVINSVQVDGDIKLESFADYYSFGLPMPGQHANTQEYELDYQGQRKDAETGFNAFELRMFDARIGRWMAPDPYEQHWSPYLAMSNNPIQFIDPDGGFDENGNDCDCFANINFKTQNEQNQDRMDMNSIGIRGIMGEGLSIERRENSLIDYDYEARTERIRIEGASDFFANFNWQITDISESYNKETNISPIINSNSSSPQASAMNLGNIPKSESIKTNRWLNTLQTGLDLVGLIPGVGEIADGLNAAIYAGRGDYTNSSLSAAAMIPFAGWAATGGKLANKGHTVYMGIKNGDKYIGITNNLKKRYTKAEREAMRIVELYVNVPSRKLARGIEQTLINRFGLENLSNKINSISKIKQNGKHKSTMDEAEKFINKK